MVALLLVVKEHAEVIEEALLGLFLRACVRGGLCGGELLHFVREDLREEMDDGLSGGQAVGDDELVDMLRMRRSVGDDEQATEGVAAEIDLVEVQMIADG